MQHHDGQRTEHASAGEANYAGYFEFSGGKSLITGEQLLGYHEQPDKVRDAWNAGAGGVIRHVTASAPALSLAAGMWDSEANDIERRDDQDRDPGDTAQAAALRMCASQARAAIALDGVQADRLRGIILEMAAAIRAQMRGDGEIRRAEVIDWCARGEVAFDIYAEA